MLSLLWYNGKQTHDRDDYEIQAGLVLLQEEEDKVLNPLG